MVQFIAVDWGTSRFRAHLIDINGKVVKRVDTPCHTAKLGKVEQVDFLIQQTEELQNTTRDLSYMICGMPGSNEGFQEVEYLPCPIDLVNLSERLVPLEKLSIEGWIVPGIRCQSRWGEIDMMRGEECQLLGWLISNVNKPLLSNQPITICLPGTHTKWVQYQNKAVENFSTSITGELYQSLLQHSILSCGEQQFNQQAFIHAVKRTAEGEPLTEMLFSTRSRMLSGEMDSKHSAAYLSGLIIGCDVAAQSHSLKQFHQQSHQQSVVIIGNDHLADLYQMALQTHQIDSIKCNGSEMVNAGLVFLFQQRMRYSLTA